MLRKATEKDITSLAKLRIEMLNEESAYEDDFNKRIFNNTVDFLRNGMEQNAVVMIVEEENEAIIAMGCINYMMLPPNDWCPSGTTAYIGSLYTLPDYRKKGIAKKILSGLVEDAIMRHCERVLLHTTNAGEKLYKDYGFDFSPTSMAFYPFRTIPKE